MVENDLVQMRKANSSMQQAHMHVYVNLARIMANSHLETQLFEERWKAAVKLLHSDRIQLGGPQA